MVHLEFYSRYGVLMPRRTCMEILFLSETSLFCFAVNIKAQLLLRGRPMDMSGTKKEYHGERVGRLARHHIWFPSLR